MSQENEVRMAQKGSKDAFMRLIKNSELSMYRVAKSFLKSDPDCADAIQEAILKAYRTIASLREPGYFKTWLIRILINECKQILKFKNRVIPIEDLIVQSQQRDVFEQAEVLEVVDSLEDELRTIVILYYFEDLPLQEVARVLELPEGTVKSRLSRARAKLAELLGNQEERGNCYGQ
ncbi:MAG: sigma-70 family RNA polymerase sigma factor [Eubacteriales bacterium]